MKKVLGAFYGSKGFTLIEAIIVVTVISIILSPILHYFYNTQNETTANQRLIKAQGEANMAIRLILDDLRKVDVSTTNLGDETIVVGANAIIIRFSDTNQEVYGVYNKTLYRLISNSKIDMSSLITTPSVLEAGTVIAKDVQTFNPVKNVLQYTVSIILAPRNVGSIIVRPVTASNNFTPRFDMN